MTFGCSALYLTSLFLGGARYDWSATSEKDLEVSGVTVELNRTLQLLQHALAYEEAERNRCSLQSADKDSRIREAEAQKVEALAR